MKLFMVGAIGTLFGSVAFAQATEWPVVEPHQRLFVTVSIDDSHRYAVATASENGGESFPYRTVSGKGQLETFGVGPGELRITVTLLDGKSTVHSIACPEERQQSSPHTVWHSRHYSSSNPNLTCRDKAEVVVTVASMQWSRQSFVDFSGPTLAANKPVSMSALAISRRLGQSSFRGEFAKTS